MTQTEETDNPLYRCPACQERTKVRHTVVSSSAITRHHYCAACGYKAVSLTVITTEAFEGRIPRGQGPTAMLQKYEQGKVAVRYIDMDRHK